MRTFGRFLHRDTLVYGEVREKEVRFLTQPFWLDFEFTGETRSLDELDDRRPGGAEQDNRRRSELPGSHQGNAADRDRLSAHLVQSAEFSAASQRALSGSLFPNIKPILKSSWRSSSGGPRRTSLSSAPSITFSVTRSRRTSAIAISRNRRSSFPAANRSIPTRRWDPLFTPKLKRATWKFRCAKTAKSGNRRVRAR